VTKLSLLQTGLFLTVCGHILWNKCTFKLYWNCILQYLFTILGTSALRLVLLELAIALIYWTAATVSVCVGVFRKHRFAVFVRMGQLLNLFCFFPPVYVYVHVCFCLLR
jgi:hypothetical protein